MSKPPEKKRIEHLESMLESRSVDSIHIAEPSLYKEESFEVKKEWEHDTPDIAVSPSLFAPKHADVPKRILVGSFVFFVIAAAIAGTIIFRGNNNLSSGNISIDISGPVAIDGGKELDLDVTVTNGNNVALELADLRVTYPDGTRNPDNLAEELKRATDPIGDLPSGQSVKKQIRAVLFGSQNEQKQLFLEVEYRVKGSNAIFTKEKTLDLVVTSSPINVTVTSLKEINSSQDVELTVDLVSNSSQVLKNVLLRGDFAFGFTFTSADPKPTFGQSVWRIGDLNPGEKRTVHVRGKVEGQDGEDRTFHFAAGIQGGTDPKVLQPEFLSVAQTISIKKPFVSLEVSLDGSNDRVYSTRAGKQIRAELTWTNNLATKVRNVKITAKINGAVLDREGVQADRGFYNSAQNTISWDQTTNPELADVKPGSTGRLSFSFASLLQKTDSFELFKGAEITIDAGVQGSRVENVDVPEALASAIRKEVHFVSDLGVISRVVHSGSAFPNTGPIPPQAEKQTTYTVIWTLSNTTNAIDNVQAIASLPSYVTWLGNISPSSEDVIFDSATGLVTWNVGQMPAGAGFSTSPKQVQFQISFVPSLSQVGETPNLVGDLSVRGTDRYTNSPVSVSRTALTTRISTDPNFVDGSERVVR